MADVKKWTPAQQDCIDARGGSIFVSAAAGSGKTAVLIERIITLLCDKDTPLDVDRLLVVTFTKAAASEMRSRLNKRLSKMLAADPHNHHLLRQQLLLPQANICTIHSFCSQIMREYAAQAGVSARFGIADSTALKLLQKETASAVVNEAYNENSDDFRALCQSMTDGLNDRAIVAQILSTYEFIQAHPFPLQWLQKQVGAFETATAVGDTVWGQIMLEQAREDLQSALEPLISVLDDISDDERVMAGYGPSVSGSIDTIQKAIDATSLGWSAAVDAVNAITFSKINTPKKYEDQEFLNRIKAQRNHAKAIIDKKVRTYLFQSEADIQRDIAAAAPIVRALYALVCRFDEAFTAAKAEQNIIDFNDLEHKTLSLLATPNDDGSFSRTELAKEIGSRFTHIMVDEYQDTNGTQDALFSALSNDEQNLFFVGDIKQSIYGFRKAMPSIFRNRRENSTPYDRNAPVFPASITLGNNFRSRVQVTDCTNFLFRRLMTKDIGGIVYDEREELVASGEFPNDRDPAYDTELLILEGEQFKNELSAPQAEARFIGEKILHMIETGYPVTDQGETRCATYRDFCILLRSTSVNGPIFTKELQAMGIPVISGSQAGFFECAEIRTALSILRTIDNPLSDIPLLAALMSPVYGFSPDDMTIIRNTVNKVPLYTALRRIAVCDGHALQARAASFIDNINRYRTLAVSVPADGLIRRLFEDTDMLSVMSAKNGSASRIANLRKLYDMARHFEDRDFKGLSAFIRHLDRLEEQDIPVETADCNNSQNAVKIMTIHGSKGLEFPVVFVARLSGKFNDQSIMSDVLMHAEYGIGVRLRDREEMQTHNPLHHQAIAAAITRSERTEALRLLYVAMTRAKDKLIMTLTTSSTLGSAVEKLLEALPRTYKQLPTSFVIRTQNMQKWVLSALLDHEAGGALTSAIDSTAPTDLCAGGLHIQTASPTLGDERPRASAQTETAVDLGDIRERIHYRYPYEALGKIPAKITASQAAHDHSESMSVYLAQPAFLSQGGLTPAQRGTATHLFFENVDLASGQSAELQADAMVANGILTDKQHDVLRFDRLNRFLQSELARRMAASSMLLREFPFAVECPLASLSQFAPPSSDTNEESVIVQGIADAVFEENGELIIVDYKTDRVSDADELVERYRAQLDIYKDALAKALQKPVKEALIYSFHLGSTVAV